MVHDVGAPGPPSHDRGLHEYAVRADRQRTGQSIEGQAGELRMGEWQPGVAENTQFDVGGIEHGDRRQESGGVLLAAPDPSRDQPRQVRRDGDHEMASA